MSLFPNRSLPNLLLLDGTSLFYRCFYALPPTLKSPDGQPVNAVYGFASVLLNLVFKEKPDYLAIAFDRRAPTFRHQEFKDYKATRTKAPDELYQQFPYIMDLLSAFSVKSFGQDGFEADDIIASLAKLHKKNCLVTILTGDKDLFQLIDLNVTVAVPKQGLKNLTLYDRQALQENYHLTPEQVPDFKGLRGDPSDNLPGVKGVGEKTAHDLLGRYQNLANIYQHLEELSPKLKEKLVASRDNAFLSKKLATLHLDLEIDHKLEDCGVGRLDVNSLSEFFYKLHFFNLAKRLAEVANRPLPVVQKSAEPEQPSLF